MSSRIGKENVGAKSNEKDVDNGGAALNIWVRSLKPNAEESRILTTGFKAEEKNIEKQLDIST